MRADTEQEFLPSLGSDVDDGEGGQRRRLQRRWLLGAVAVVLVVAMVAAFTWAANRGDEPVAATATSTDPTLPPSSTVTTAVGPPTTPPATAPPSTEVPAMATYTGAAYPLMVDYPAGWQQVAGDPSPSFEGTDGFFTVDGTASPDSVDDVCQAQVADVLAPFGTSPTIEALIVDGQEACLILPSADQPVDMRNAGRVVARLPYELFSVGYNFLVLDADAPHMRAIAASIRFLGHD